MTAVERKKHQSLDKIKKAIYLITMLKEKTVTNSTVVGMMTLKQMKILIKSSMVNRLSSMRLEPVPCQLVINSIKKATLISLCTMMTRNLRILNGKISE